MLTKLISQLKDLITSDGSAVTPAPEGEFVKGINLGGDALAIEGNTWDAYSTALTNGLSAPGASGIATSVQPVPYAPPNLRQMLNSVIFKPETLELTQVLPPGNYDVYLWIMENYQTNWHSLEVRLNGKVVATGIGQLAAGHWERYGPYATTVSETALHLTLSTHNPKIDAHLMGVSIFRR
jgi:hypothetical protein